MMLIRLAKDSDRDQVKELENALPENERSGIDFLDSLLGKNFKHSVCIMSKKVVAHCIYSNVMGNIDITIDRLATHPDFRRKGYAYELVRSLKRKVKVTHKDCRIQCIIDETSPWQRAFFKECGFIITEQVGGNNYLMEYMNAEAAVPRILKNRIANKGAKDI